MNWKHTFKLLSITIAASLGACSSVYVTKNYSGMECHQKVSDYLQKQGWVREIEEDQLIFKKGSKLALTLNYESEKLEVKTILRKKEDGSFDLSVGNVGVIGEVHMMEPRFQRLSNKLGEYVQENCKS